MYFLRIALSFIFACSVWAAALGAGQLPSPTWAPGTIPRNLGYAPMNGANNLSEVVNKALARANLGIANTNTLPFDNVMNYGASGSSQQTTGSIAASQSTLTVASVADFTVGQGVRILGAGATLNASPITVSSTLIQGTAGSVTYNYSIASIGFNGSISAAVPVTVTSGPNAVIVTHLDNTTTTYYGSTQNYVQINLTQGSNSSGWVVYRGINGSTPTLWTIGAGSVFKDQGIGWTSNNTVTGSWVGPDYLPTTAPVTGSNDWLVATITAINGTTLTLSTPAINTVSGAIIYHSDTAAFNAAATAPTNAAGANIVVPCGNYNLESVVAATVNYLGFTGSGMCTIINEHGTGYDFSFPNSNTLVLQRGNFVQNLYLVDRNKSNGYVVNATNTYNVLFANLEIDFPAQGFNFLNNNLIDLDNVIANNGTRATSSTWMRFASDSANYECCIYAYNVYSHGNGVYADSTTSVGVSIGGTDKLGYSFDGNVGTVYGVGMAASNIEGVGWQFFNDTSNFSSPGYLQFAWASSEFSNGRAINMFGPSGGAGPVDVYFTASTITGAQNGNANVVIDNLSSRIQFDGGKIENAGCRGIDIAGTQVSLTGGIIIGNNSSASTGGTAGTCDGIVLEAASRGTLISGIHGGDPNNASVQRYPVTIVNGADYFSITGNEWYGNVDPCVNNGGTTAASRVISGNAGTSSGAC